MNLLLLVQRDLQPATISLCDSAVSAVLIALLQSPRTKLTQACSPNSKSVTVPITLDHNRVVIDVSFPLPDGSTQRVHAWVDNGNPDLYMSQRLAATDGGYVTCDGQTLLRPSARWR